MKRIIGAVIGGCFILLIFWLGGYNFDSRGLPAVVCAFYTMLAAVAGWTVAGLAGKGNEA